MANRIKGITVEIGGDTTKLSKALEGVNKNIKNTQTQLKDVQKLLKLDPTNTELLSQKHKLLADEVTATKEKLETLKTAAEQANQALANGDISQEQYDALQREIIETEQELQNLQREAEASGTALAKLGQAGEMLEKAGDKIADVGTTLTTHVTVPVMAAGTAAVKTAADFDSAMSKVAAVSGATGDELDALRDKAREMGAKTKFSASEAADAMNYMAMAGWKTTDMLDGIEGIMNLAAASGEELATTSDIVTDALTAFGLTAADSGHFADVLAAASSNANTNVGMMGETFKYAAPVAGAFGFSCEDTAEAIGLMANAGIKSSSAGTSLRSIMNALAGDVSFCGESIGEVAIQTTNADGSMRELSDILADCRVVFNQLSESEQASAAQALVGKNAMSGFLAIMNAAPSDISKLSDAIENCDGTALRMAETMQDNLEGQITILKSQLQELAISFGEILMPKIRAIVSRLQAFMDKLNQMDPATKEIIIKIALIAASLGPLLIVLGKTISTIGSLMTFISNLPTLIASAKSAFAVLSGALSGALAPILAVAAVIAVLVDAFKHLWDTNEEFRNTILETWEQIKNTFSALTEGIVERVNALGFDFESFSEMIKTIWDSLCNFLKPLFETTFQQIADIFKLVSDVILGTLDVFIGIFTGDWDKAWNGIKEIFKGIWDFLKSYISNVLNMINGIFGTSFNSINDVVTSVLTAVKNFFSNIWNEIKNNVSNVLNTIKALVALIWSEIQSKITEVMNSIKNTVSSIWDNVKSAVSNKVNNIKDTIVNGFENAVNYVKNLAGQAWNWGSDIIGGIVNGIRSKINDVVSAVTNVADTIRSYLHFSVPDVGPLTDFESWMPDFMSGLAEGINKNKKLITNAISGVAESMQLTMKTDMGVNFDSMTASMKDTVSAGTVVNNYNNSRTVNQTNNSPKSLSRLEIYRQTRNAMNV